MSALWTAPVELSHPPAEFSVMPFWFWNDELDGDEIIRQMADFQQHGVEGFVIHPRVGLPRSLGWMSDRLLGFYQTAIEAARQMGMKVVLYDEGMYPSGSSCGQVVAANPAFACRCLAKIELASDAATQLKPNENLVAVVPRVNGTRLAVIDRPANSFIRGLHYIGEGPAEDEPPAGDILNPQAVATFISLVYDKFAAHFGAYFGSTILAIFTDEPGLLGRSRERGIMPGTTGILEHVNRFLGYEFTPHLPALWYDDEPEAAHYRQEYARAVSLRLEETYYQPLFAWCEAHNLALTGHPAKGDDIGPLRYFHIPGQDLVWRWVLPDEPTALEGVESSQAKCASSAMLHHGRRRNANECCGAYGHELTWDEMNWLARWTLVRGANLLFPHAFYYSVRGPRWDERPPDVGPHSAWWQRFPEFAWECRRLSWLNTDSTQLCKIAILGRADHLPWQAAKICFRHQFDFNYIEERDILEQAAVDAGGIRLAGMTYEVLILEHQPGEDVMAALTPLAQAGGVFLYSERTSAPELVAWLDTRTPKDFQIQPAAPGLRIRQVQKGPHQYMMLFNEEHQPIDITFRFSDGRPWVIYNPGQDCAQRAPVDQSLHLKGYELTVLVGGSVW